jgi:hypothetical protein
MTLQSPLKLIENLGFEETIRLACAMLMNEKWEESLQNFAVELLNHLKDSYVEQWNSSWRFDGLLGFANDIIMNYDERYAAFKRALAKANPAPPELLIAYAKCNSSPGEPPVTRDEAISLVQQAIKDELYPEGVMFLRGLYWSAKDESATKYWSDILDSVKDQKSTLPQLYKIPGITG